MSQCIPANKGNFRGEHAATALETNLTNLENKLDEILASIERGLSGADVDNCSEKNGRKEEADGHEPVTGRQHERGKEPPRP